MKEKKVIPIILLFIVLIFIISTYAQNSKIYKSGIFNFSIEYPADYEVKEISGIIAFVSPRKDQNDTFSENVNIVVENLNQTPMDLDQYYALTKETLSNTMQKLSFIEEQKDILDGLEAYRIVYTAEQNGTIFKYLQEILIHKNNAYVITYMALPEEFDNYLSDTLFIVNSFKILDK